MNFLFRLIFIRTEVCRQIKNIETKLCQPPLLSLGFHLICGIHANSKVVTALLNENLVTRLQGDKKFRIISDKKIFNVPKRKCIPFDFKSKNAKSCCNNGESGKRFVRVELIYLLLEKYKSLKLF